MIDGSRPSLSDGQLPAAPRPGWRRLAGTATASTLTALLLLVISAPLIATLLSSLWSAPFIKLPGHLTLHNFSQALGGDAAASRLSNTLIYAVGATLIAMVVGAALALITTRVDLPFPRLMTALPVASLFLPGLLKDIAWIELYNPRSGLFNLAVAHLGFHDGLFNIYSMHGMILSDGLTGAAVPYIILLGPLRSMNQSLEEASRSAGAGPLRTFLQVTLPVMRPALISGFALTMVIVASEFETPVMIGVPGNVLTYISSLYSSVGGAGSPNYDLAAAQSVLYLVFTGLLLAWYVRSTRMESRFAIVGGRGASRAKLDIGRWKFFFAAVVVIEFIISCGQLIVATVLTSLVPFYTTTDGNPFKTFNFANYRSITSDRSLVESIVNSLMLALLVAVITVVLATLLAFVSLKTSWKGRRLAEVIATLPIGLPPVVFSAALLITVLSVPGMVVLYGTIVPLIIADVVVTLPFGVRVLSGALISLRDELLEASASCGGGMFRTLRSVILPLLAPAMVDAAVLVFVRAFLQLGAIVFVTTPNFGLLPSQIFSVWGTGNYGLVNALNVVSAVLPAIVLLVVYLVRMAVVRVVTRVRVGRARVLVAADVAAAA